MIEFYKVIDIYLFPHSFLRSDYEGINEKNLLNKLSLFIPASDVLV